MTDLIELAERCERGSGADRELDADIAMAVLGLTHDGRPEPYRNYTRTDADGFQVTGADTVMVRPYTISLDATVALLERVLPGWMWSVSASGNSWATVTGPPNRVGYWTSGHPKSPARALLAATLRALSSKEPT